jgi:SNF2 family DNA or RNA helicase
MNADGEQVTAVNAAANLNKLLQCSGGSVYTDTGEVLEFDIAGRYNVLKEIIGESSHKILIFVPYRHTIYRLQELLNKDNMRTEVIHGDVNVNRRSKIFDRFETKDDLDVLIIQPQAASHGVTLVAASTVVYWGPVMSVETYLQCNARVHRKGQMHKTTIVHLQGS